MQMLLSLASPNLFDEKSGLKLGEFNNTIGKERVNSKAGNPLEWITFQNMGNIPGYWPSNLRKFSDLILH